MIAMKEFVVIYMHPVLIGIKIASYESVGVELSLEGAKLIGPKITR